MKLLRLGQPGCERPAILDRAGDPRWLPDDVADVDAAMIASGQIDALRSLDVESLPMADVGLRVAPCLGSVGKIIGVGLNYADHAAEAGMKVPDEPILFSKAVSAICGANDDLQLPRGSVSTDWEVELAVVIGRRAQYVSKADALAHVAGYCVINDLSERDFQIRRKGQWLKGKSHDSFAPLGPWLVTVDEIDDPQQLSLYSEVNGVRMQDGTTTDMIVGAASLVSYISEFMTLLPGDVIATGTPPGVGMGRTPPLFLKAGDRLRVGIDGLGEQQQRVVSQ
ncbi:fumarylacetoacetate hydrolase family protein [Gammaproteobacteria bacterium]|nr:fumarylacetoacetate hydrolase family protein [Gammaproteobacteria bacterium]